MANRRFEYRDERSNKYWEIDQIGLKVVTHWGRIGAAGAFQVKEFYNENAAGNHYLQQIKGKTSKGYIEVTSDTEKAIDPTQLLDKARGETYIPASPMDIDKKQKRSFKF